MNRSPLGHDVIESSAAFMSQKSGSLWTKSVSGRHVFVSSAHPFSPVTAAMPEAPTNAPSCAHDPTKPGDHRGGMGQ